MSLLFGGKPEEVPLRRKILRVLVFAASKASTFLILEPVLQVAIVVYIMLVKAGVVPNPKKEKAPLEEPLDAEASVE